MTTQREKAHDQMRVMGYSDDAQPVEPCGSTAAKLLILIILSASMLASAIGQVTI